MRPLRKVEVKRLFADAAKSYPPKVELAFLLQSVEDRSMSARCFALPMRVGRGSWFLRV